MTLEEGPLENKPREPGKQIGTPCYGKGVQTAKLDENWHRQLPRQHSKTLHSDYGLHFQRQAEGTVSLGISLTVNIESYIL